MKFGPSQLKWHDHFWNFLNSTHPTIPTNHFYTQPNQVRGFSFYRRLNKSVGAGRYEEILVYKDMWTTNYRNNPSIYRLYRRVIVGGEVLEESLISEVPKCADLHIRRYERQGYSPIDQWDVVV